jgi:hypothetical protein
MYLIFRNYIGDDWHEMLKYGSIPKVIFRTNDKEEYEKTLKNLEANNRSKYVVYDTIGIICY